MSSGLRAALAVALILVGGTIGFLVARLARAPRAQPPLVTPAGGADSAGGASAQNESPDGRSLAPRIPGSLPDIVLPDVHGVRRALRDWKGHPLLINFWATWCEPCRREIPLLKALLHERSAQGLEIIGIAVDLHEAVQRYAREKGIDYPVLVGEDDGLAAIRAFGVIEPVFPFTVFTDRQGRIVTLKVGELHPEEARYLLDKVREIDQARIGLTAAQKDISSALAAFSAQRARQAVRTSADPQPP